MTDWQLPAHIHDHLAPETHWLEAKRRVLLDYYFAHGFRLIMPPMAEYQEALAQGGQDVDRRMIKVVDHLSGRMLGLRPDITPQAARIDAHVLAEEGVTRLCYSDRALHAHPSTPFAEREPWHIGAEIYGETSWLADAEAIRLLQNTLILCDIASPMVEVHHMGIIRELANVSGLSALPQWISLQDEYLQALQTKDVKALLTLLQSASVEKVWGGIFEKFINLFGDDRVLDSAQTLFADYPTILSPINDLQQLACELAQDEHPITLTFDLSDGRGYHYHTGIMFSAYAAEWSQALAQGGRYDGFGARFGRSRPATGFTINLFEVSLCAHRQNPLTDASLPFQHRLFVDRNLLRETSANAYIKQLRAQNMAVIVAPTPEGKNSAIAAQHHACNGWITFTQGAWHIHSMHSH